MWSERTEFDLRANRSLMQCRASNFPRSLKAAFLNHLKERGFAGVQMIISEG